MQKIRFTASRPLSLSEFVPKVIGEPNINPNLNTYIDLLRLQLSPSQFIGSHLTEFEFQRNCSRNYVHAYFRIFLEIAHKVFEFRAFSFILLGSQGRSGCESAQLLDSNLFEFFCVFD